MPIAFGVPKGATCHGSAIHHANVFVVKWYRVAQLARNGAIVQPVSPPKDVIDHIHDSGRLVAALCGRAKQALRHKEAGVDIIIAQGTEAGGHTGEIAGMVLCPEVVDFLHNWNHM